MKGVLFLGDHKAEVREFPTPDPAPGEVLVRMKAASICGTDMHAYRRSWEDLVAFRQSLYQKSLEDLATSRGASRDSLEVIPGHEPCGIVEAVGAQVMAVKPGDRVTIYQHVGCGRCGFCRKGNMMFCPERRGFGTVNNGSAADFILAPERNCLQLPDALSFDKAAVLACAGGTGYQSINRLDVSGADTVAIFGLGPVGLSAAMFAAARGARVFGVDLIPERLELARQIGAAQTIDAAQDQPLEVIQDLTRGKGVDAGADYSGNSQAQETMLACAGKGARLAIVGVGESFRVDTLKVMIMKQLTLMGSWIYSMGQHDEIVDFVLEKELPVEKLITHRFRIEQAPEAFALFDSGKTGKVLFTWDDDRKR